MSILKMVFKNFGALFLSEIISKGLGFLLIVYLARQLGNETFGLYSFAVAFITIFSMFTDFGLDTLFIRDVAKNKTLMDHYFSNILGIKIFLSVLTYGLVILSAVVLKYSAEMLNFLKILSLTLILDTLSNQYISFFKIIEDMKYISYAQVGYSIFKTVGGMSAVVAGYNLKALMGILVFASLLRLGILIICSIKKGLRRVRIRFNFSAWKQFFRNSLPFALLSIFVIIYFRIDIVMLERMTNLSVVGWYNAAYAIFILSASLAIIFTGVVFPTMSLLDALSKTKFKQMYLYCFRLMAVFGILFSAGGWVLARPIIRVIYGSNYEPAAVASQILFATLLPVFLASLTGKVISIYNPGINLRIAALVMVPLNIMLNLMLIPRYSLNGAALATLLTETTGALLSIYFASKYLGKVSFRELLSRDAGQFLKL